MAAEGEESGGGEMTATWDVLELGINVADTISLCCPKCSADAEMPIAKSHSPIIAAIGLGLIFDDPTYIPEGQLLPSVIRCRHCRETFVIEREGRDDG